MRRFVRCTNAAAHQEERARGQTHSYRYGQQLLHQTPSLDKASSMDTPPRQPPSANIAAAGDEMGSEDPRASSQGSPAS